jgi:signal transduction histidine kinase
VEIRRGPPAGAFALSQRTRTPPRPTTTFFADPDQKVVLGRALSNRVTEATRLIAEAASAAGLSELASRRFAKPIRHVHNLATRGVANFLITGQGSSEKERNFIGRLGVMAALHGLSVATLTRSYLLWRDTNLRVLNEEVARLGTALAFADEARTMIRSSADTGIVRMARAYDYQMHVVRGREDGIKLALHDSESLLQSAIVDASRKNDQLSAAMVEISDKNVQLSVANRQQTDFIVNVSHELRTPLAGILG